jgi:2-hydroxychromene-2-carboxylate isomerase
VSLPVAFYYSVGSRYSYLAATQIAALERNTGAKVDWVPVSSVALMRAAGYEPFTGTPTSGQYDFKFRQTDAEAWAAYYGVPYREPDDPLGLPGECAIAACAAALMDAAIPFSQAFFRAHFVDGLRIRGNAEIEAVAASAGLDRKRFAALLADPASEKRLRMSIERARRDGAFGVPSFAVGRQLFWGNDRLPLVRHALGDTAARDDQ